MLYDTACCILVAGRQPSSLYAVPYLHESRHGNTEAKRVGRLRATRDHRLLPPPPACMRVPLAVCKTLIPV